jgi:hypothetical protein
MHQKLLYYEYVLILLLLIMRMILLHFITICIVRNEGTNSHQVQMLLLNFIISFERSRMMYHY